MKRIVVVLLVALSVFAGAGAAWATPEQEAAVVDGINAFRQQNGLAPLAVDPVLQDVADRWAGQMAASGSLTHNPSLYSEVGGWSSMGENIAFNGSPEDIVASWEASTVHRNNMLEPSFDSVGVGVIEDAGGTLWAVADFSGSGGAYLTPVEAAAPEEEFVEAEPEVDPAAYDVEVDDSSAIDLDAEYASN